MINFYLFLTDKKIVVSDQPLERVKKKYGYKFEIINSIKDKASQNIDPKEEDVIEGEYRRDDELLK